MAEIVVWENMGELGRSRFSGQSALCPADRFSRDILSEVRFHVLGEYAISLLW